jgi:hypothetical protein
MPFSPSSYHVAQPTEAVEGVRLCLPSIVHRVNLTADALNSHTRSIRHKYVEAADE